jgi:hypothetical protein
MRVECVPRRAHPESKLCPSQSTKTCQGMPPRVRASGTLVHDADPRTSAPRNGSPHSGSVVLAGARRGAHTASCKGHSAEFTVPIAPALRGQVRRASVPEVAVSRAVFNGRSTDPGLLDRPPWTDSGFDAVPGSWIRSLFSSRGADRGSADRRDSVEFVMTYADLDAGAMNAG